MKTIVLAIAVSTAMLGCSSPQQQAKTYPTQPFGSASDVKYSANLWNTMETRGLVGPHALLSTPYEGQAPHGTFLDTVDTRLTMKGNNGALIIKRNYGGEGVSKQAVADEPAQYLKAVTVMYRRDGYDVDNQNWFWVKYKPDGSLFMTSDGKQLAGRVAKDMSSGCIACHQSAPGGDYVFNHDRLGRPWVEATDPDTEEAYYDNHDNHGDHVHY